jgi:hypothetical protein
MQSYRKNMPLKGKRQKEFEDSKLKETIRNTGMVVHIYNPSTPEAEARGSPVQVNLGYIVRFCLTQPKQLKKKKEEISKRRRGRRGRRRRRILASQKAEIRSIVV